MMTEAMQKAGDAAERQMQHYLRREFTDSDPLRIIHNLRLHDPALTEADGSPAVSQIDHFVVHPRGAFIIESKSIHDRVRIGSDGTGGDEWARSYQGRWLGMNSPLRQAERQAKVLRNMLQANRRALLAPMKGVNRLLGKLLVKTDQRGFINMPTQIIVAVSGSGIIDRVRGWKEPTEPYQSFVCKADLVSSKIKEELARHAQSPSLLGKSESQYGIWQMNLAEVIAVSEFLQSMHTPLQRSAKTSARSPSPPSTQCPSCSGTKLAAMSGKYGYYWKCSTCNTNTSMAKVCGACGAKSDRGRVVKAHKVGMQYLLRCSACNYECDIWNTSWNHK